MRALDCEPILHAESLTEPLRRPLAGSLESSLAIPIDRLIDPTLAGPLNVQCVVPFAEPLDCLLVESCAVLSTVASRFLT